MGNDLLSPKEAVLMLKELIGSQRGFVSMLACEEGQSYQRMRYKIESLCRRMEKLDNEVHQMFFLLGQNVTTQYHIHEERERGDEDDGDEPVYVREFVNPDTDPRALGKFKYYVENFLKSRKKGQCEVDRFRDSLKGRYMKLRKMGLSALVDELEKLRRQAKMDLNPFYQLVSKLVERPNGKIYHFGWLFHAGGASDEHNEFIERVKLELGSRKEGTGKVKK